MISEPRSIFIIVIVVIIIIIIASGGGDKYHNITEARWISRFNIFILRLGSQQPLGENLSHIYYEILQPALNEAFLLNYNVIV